MGNGGQCAYRSEDGDKCAVGCLIPDSDYREAFEGTTVLGLRSYGQLKWSQTLTSFLVKGQNCHDGAKDRGQGLIGDDNGVPGFLIKLKKLAINHGLDVAKDTVDSTLIHAELEAALDTASEDSRILVSNA